MTHQLAASAIEGSLLQQELADLDAAGPPRLLRRIPKVMLGLESSVFVAILCGIVFVLLITCLLAVCFRRAGKEREVSGARTSILWKVTHGMGIAIRSSPDVNGRKSGLVLAAGDVFRVVRAMERDGVLYLKLAGSGHWVFSGTKEHGVLCERYEGAEPAKLATGQRPRKGTWTDRSGLVEARQQEARAGFSV